MIKKPKQKKPVKKRSVSSKPKKSYKKGVISMMLAASLMLGSHLSVQRNYGKAYVKKIPVVSRLVSNKNNFDFYFSPHASAKDLVKLENLLKDAKKSGRPYTHILMESANLPHSEIKNQVLFFNKNAKLFKEFIDMREGLEIIISSAKVKHPKEAKELESQLVRLNKLVYDLVYNSDTSFSTKREYLAAKYNLKPVFAESYSQAELDSLKRLHKNASDYLLDSNNKRYASTFAELVRTRDRRIKQTILEFERKQKNPVNAIVVFGTMHSDVARRFDRNSFSSSRIVVKEYAGREHYLSEEEYLKHKQIMRTVNIIKQKVRRMR